MAYLQINGVAVANQASGVREIFEDVGADDADGIIGNVMRQRTRQRRTWTFRTPPMVVAKAMAMRRLIEGFGMRWPRLYVDGSASQYSSTGVTYSVNSGAVTLTTTGGPTPVPLRATIASGGYAGFRLQSRMGVHRFNGWDPDVDGFTVICWRYWVAAEGVADGWYRTIITGASSWSRGVSANPTGVTQYRNAVAGTYNLGRCLAVGNYSPFVSLHGYLNTNAASAVDFADVVFLPYALPSSWIAGIDTFMQTHPLSDLPLLWLSGDGISDAAPVLVMGRVREMSQVVGTLEGAHAATHRILDVELRETI